MRDDIIKDIDPNARLDIAARPIPILQRLYAMPALRRVLVVVMLAVIWQIYASWLQNPLMVPTLSDTLQAFVTDMASGPSPTSTRCICPARGIVFRIPCPAA